MCEGRAEFGLFMVCRGARRDQGSDYGWIIGPGDARVTRRDLVNGLRGRGELTLAWRFKNRVWLSWQGQEVGREGWNKVSRL